MSGDDEVPAGTPSVPTEPAATDPAATDPAVPDRSASTVLAVLGVWAALHVVTAPLISGGTRLAVVLVAELLATAGVSVLVVLGERVTSAFPAALPCVLAAGGALAGIRGAAAGDPLLGLDAGLWLAAAAVLVRPGALVAVSVATGVPWVAAGAYALVHLTRLGGPGPLGSASGWGHGLAMLAGGAGLAVALQRRFAAQVSAEQVWQARFRDSAVNDSLTGAVNRSGAELIFRPMIEHARRGGQAVNCLYIDVDDLRGVNEAVGLSAGDDVLCAVARAVTRNVRGTDLVCRWTGDEFVVLGPGTGMSPLELERRIRAALLASPPVPTEIWTGKVSIGSATLVPWDEGDLSALVDKAEKDMQLRRSLRRKSRQRPGPTGVQGPGDPAGPTHRPGGAKA